MKNIYEAPVSELIYFASEDIMTASDDIEDDETDENTGEI